MPARTFSDILIEPQYSEVMSRHNVDISSNLFPDCSTTKLRLPVVSSNMKTITGPDMALEMDIAGAWGILHRFNSIEEAVQEFIDTHIPGNTYQPGVSIGVSDADKDRFHALFNQGAKFFCIDVAHGHHKLVQKMIEFCKSEHEVKIIAGNIATKQGLKDLAAWGADCVKVGIGPGSVCTTRRNAGTGVPQLYALEQCYGANEELDEPITIIADGGCSTPGDIAKALKYSDAVMIGGMIKGTAETPGKVFRNEEGMYYKSYGGSSSGETKGSNDFIEGVHKSIPFMGHVKFILREIEHGIRSAFSYSNANSLKEFQQRCRFIDISSGGRLESKL